MTIHFVLHLASKCNFLTVREHFDRSECIPINYGLNKILSDIIKKINELLCDSTSFLMLDFFVWMLLSCQFVQYWQINGRLSKFNRRIQFRLSKEVCNPLIHFKSEQHFCCSSCVTEWWFSISHVALLFLDINRIWCPTKVLCNVKFIRNFAIPFCSNRQCKKI